MLVVSASVTDTQQSPEGLCGGKNGQSVSSLKNVMQTKGSSSASSGGLCHCSAVVSELLLVEWSRHIPMLFIRTIIPIANLRRNVCLSCL